MELSDIEKKIYQQFPNDFLKRVWRELSDKIDRLERRLERMKAKKRYVYDLIVERESE